MSKTVKKAGGASAAGAAKKSGGKSGGRKQAEPERIRPRAVLITPFGETAPAFAATLADALAGGDAAAVLIAPGDVEPEILQPFAEALVPVAQGAGAAAIVAGDTRVAGRTKADGVHLPFGHEDLAPALETFPPARMVGVGLIKERDAAMEAAEDGADYVLFGLIDRADADETHPKTIDFATWWAEVFEIPCIAVAGRTAEAVEAAIRTGAEFVAVRAAVWEHPDGPQAGLAQVNRLIDAVFAEQGQS